MCFSPTFPSQVTSNPASLCLVQFVNHFSFLSFFFPPKVSIITSKGGLFTDTRPCGTLLLHQYWESTVLWLTALYLVEACRHHSTSFLQFRYITRTLGVAYVSRARYISFFFTRRRPGSWPGVSFSNIYIYFFEMFLAFPRGNVKNCFLITNVGPVEPFWK